VIELHELAARLGEVLLLDVRTEDEFTGARGKPCDPRQGHIPGARHLELSRIVNCETPDDVRALVGVPAEAEVVAY
jgi:3-mercaptopyruvate sulfurtransferase SseA